MKRSPSATRGTPHATPPRCGPSARPCCRSRLAIPDPWSGHRSIARTTDHFKPLAWRGLSVPRSPAPNKTKVARFACVVYMARQLAIPDRWPGYRSPALLASSPGTPRAPLPPFRHLRHVPRRFHHHTRPVLAPPAARTRRRLFFGRTLCVRLVYGSNPARISALRNFLIRVLTELSAFPTLRPGQDMLSTRPRPRGLAYSAPGSCSASFTGSHALGARRAPASLSRPSPVPRPPPCRAPERSLRAERAVVASRLGARAPGPERACARWAARACAERSGPFRPTSSSRSNWRSTAHLSDRPVRG